MKWKQPFGWAYVVKMNEACISTFPNSSSYSPARVQHDDPHEPPCWCDLHKQKKRPRGRIIIHLEAPGDKTGTHKGIGSRDVMFLGCFLIRTPKPTVEVWATDTIEFPPSTTMMWTQRIHAGPYGSQHVSELKHDGVVARATHAGSPCIIEICIFIFYFLTNAHNHASCSIAPPTQLYIFVLVF